MPVNIGTRRTPPKNQDILFEPFDGSMIDPWKWLIVDTETKILQIGGSLIFLGGKAIPGHGDPMIEAIKSLSRNIGLTFEARVQSASTTNAYGPYLILSSAIPYTTEVTHAQHQIALLNTGYLRVAKPSAGTIVPVAYSAATWYWLRIMVLATGAYFWVSYDGITYYRIWNEPTGTTSLLYAAIQTYVQAGEVRDFKVYNASVPSPIISITPSSVTPATTGQILTNPDFEAFTAGLADNWTKAGAPTLTQEGAIKHAGASSQKIAGASEYDGVFQAANTTATTWVRWTIWGYCTAGSLVLLAKTNTLNNTILSRSVAATSTWTQLLATGRAVGPASGFHVYQNGATAMTGYTDDGAVEPLTLASLHSLAGDSGRKSGLFEAPLTIVAGTQAGIAICLDNEANPAYELYAYCDRTTVVLINRVNNVEGAALISTATGVTYTDGRKLRIVIVPVAGSANSSVAVYYESAANVVTQIGTTQTIDLSLHGTKVAWFSTSASNAPGLVQAHA
jgi:hypothetical protein